MKRTCPDSWIFVAALATASCAGRYQVGLEPGADGASGSQVTTGPAATTASSTTTGAGGGMTPGSGGQGGGMQEDAGPGARCGFTPDSVGSSSPTAPAMVILSRIQRFLDDASSVPPGPGPSQPTADWARAQAMAILDGHLAAGTEAAGFLRFLTGWLALPAADAGVSPAHAWSVRLLDPNATLATLLAGPTGDPRRNGILTDRQMLTARPTISGRGAWLTANLFCEQVPPPPSNLPPGGPQLPGLTRRQQLERDVTMAPCVACHAILDPPGYALEHFDPFGNYRDVDNDLPVDSTGTLQQQGISFQSIDDLAPQLSESCAVAQCFTRRMMSDAFGVDPFGNLPFDEEEINHVANAFANSNFSIRELVKAIVSTPSFLR
jgi:hypothetical protein